MFSCDQCDASITTMINLKRNELKRTGNCYPCPYCEKTLCRRIHAFLQLQQHANPPVSRFTCDQCEASFYRRSTLENHIVTLQGTGENFTCDTCGKVFDWPDKLKRHTKTSHEELARGRGSLPATSAGGFLTGATR